MRSLKQVGYRSLLIGLSCLVSSVSLGTAAIAQDEQTPEPPIAASTPTDAPSSQAIAPPEPTAAPVTDSDFAPATPKATASPSAAPLQVDSSEVFIDRTDYSLGATQRETPETIAAKAARARVSRVSEVASAAPVQAGPVSFSSAGVSWNPAAIAPDTTTPGSLSYFSKKLLQPATGQTGIMPVKLMFPLAIPAPITSLFGWRIHPITGEQRVHTGTDLGAPMGTPVLAALAGRVLLADFLGGYGLTIALEHADGTQQTLYGHLSEIFVKPGELVQQGAAIGLVGSTGNSTGPHLHFEFRELTDEGWVALDPGQQLQIAMADLVKSLQVAQAGKATASAKLPGTVQ